MRVGDEGCAPLGPKYIVRNQYRRVTVTDVEFRASGAEETRGIVVAVGCGLQHGARSGGGLAKGLRV